MALKPGTRVGPYEITAALGAGGMGEVYRATDTKLKRPLWREDGRELFYLREDGAFMAAKVVDGASQLTFSRPEVLFQAPELVTQGGSRRQFAVLDDGERFIFNEVTAEHPPRSIDIVKNWRSLVEAR